MTGTMSPRDHKKGLKMSMEKEEKPTGISSFDMYLSVWLCYFVGSSRNSRKS